MPLPPPNCIPKPIIAYLLFALQYLSSGVRPNSRHDLQTPLTVHHPDPLLHPPWDGRDHPLQGAVQRRRGLGLPHSFPLPLVLRSLLLVLVPHGRKVGGRGAGQAGGALADLGGVHFVPLPAHLGLDEGTGTLLGVHGALAGAVAGTAEQTV